MPEFALVEVTGAAGEILAPEWLARAEPVHRQLRDRLPHEDDLREAIGRIARFLESYRKRHAG